MSKILKHIQASCFEPNTCDGSCYGCTLGICKVCGLFEGSLTTHCPGVQSYSEWSDKVYEEGWDYKDGKWYKKDNDDWNRCLFEEVENDNC